MSATADSADWVRTESRRQNTVVLVVIVACLLVAFFPRNERRLFTFEGEGGVIATITAPFQTQLRQAIFGPYQPEGERRQQQAKAPERFEMVLPLSEPMVEFPPVEDDWKSGFFNEPLAFDIKPPAPEFMGDQGLKFFGDPFRPVHYPPSGPVFGAVPEPGTWAMLIIGFGFIMWRIRASRLRAVRRRQYLRWRQDLVPKAV
jgi:hypothetical protein